MKTVGQIIKEKRKAKNLTQTELGEQIGVHQRTISAWECGEFFPNVIYGCALADVFGCAMDELCGRKERINQ